MLQLYLDFRVGKPTSILANQSLKFMFIPDRVRKCVVYVASKSSFGSLILQGTAFLVHRSFEGMDIGVEYLVTAKHIIQGIQAKDDFDGKIYLQVNIKDGDAFTIETNSNDWRFHPEEIEVDVAVLPHTILGENFDVAAIPLEMFLTPQLLKRFDVRVGDDVFLTGLFYNHPGRKRSIPILRVGNIAAMPEEKVQTNIGFIDAYLVEARSIGGISGSPVFAYMGDQRQVHPGLIISGFGMERFYLLGLMHGHFDVKIPSEDGTDIQKKNIEYVNMGIAIVVPSEKILEVLNQPMIREKEIESENALRSELLLNTDSIDEDVLVTSES
jgi:hypothetical protein